MIALRGVIGKGDEVIKALTNCGGVNTFALSGGFRDMVYYIDPEEETPTINCVKYQGIIKVIFEKGITIINI